MTQINEKAIRCYRKSDMYYCDSTYVLTDNEFITFFEKFRLGYHKISKKYGICVSYFERENGLSRDIDYSLHLSTVYDSMFNNGEGIPCFMFEKKEKVHLNLCNDRYAPIISTSCMYNSKLNNYSIRFMVYSYNFFAEYVLWGSKVKVNNSFSYYTNTTRYNSYFRELKKLFLSLGITNYTFDGVANELSNSESINNKGELLKIGGEVIFYEDIYELLPENEKYRPFEEIEIISNIQ